MTSLNPAAGHARPTIPVIRTDAADRLVSTPVVSGVRALAVGIAAPLATATAAAGAVAIGGGASFEIAAGGAPAASGAAPAVGLGLFGVGVVAALVQGARSSDRSGRRRGTAIGLGLIAGAVLVSALVGLVQVGGFLAGVGVVMVAMAAPAWLGDIRMPRAAVAALSLVAVAAGVAAGVFAPWPSVVVLVLAAALVAVVVPETIPGPQTPTWMLPAKPDLRGRGTSVGVVALVAVVLPFSFLPLAPAAIAAGVVVVVVVLAVAAAAVDASSEVARRRAAKARGVRAPGGSAAVVLAAPGTRAHKAATKAFDTTEPLRPARAVVATSADEVASAVREARELGLGVRMHTTGHAAASSSDMSGEVLVKVRIAGEVTVDVERRLVRIPAGTQWSDVVAATAPHGLAVPHGSSGHVGVVGYLSRGGLSAYGRTTGIAANHLESVELVTADGRVVTASRDVEPDLFWAVRGGGGGFGVITAMTVRAFVPGEVVTGTAMWEIADARAVARAWAEWTADAPANITTSLRLMTLPPLPGFPFKVTRRPMLVIDGTAIDRDGLAAAGSAGDLLARLRRVAAPVFDSWRSTDIAEVAKTHMDPDFGGIAHRTDTALLGGAAGRGPARSRAIVDAFLDVVTADGAPFLMAELRQLGGALGQAPDDAGAVGRFDADFAWFGGVMIGRKRSAEDAAAAFTAARSAFAEWVTEYTVPTFAADRDRPQRNYSADVRARVERIRTAVDPEGRFRGDVSVGALAS